MFSSFGVNPFWRVPIVSRAALARAVQPQNSIANAQNLRHVQTCPVALGLLVVAHIGIAVRSRRRCDFACYSADYDFPYKKQSLISRCTKLCYLAVRKFLRLSQSTHHPSTRVLPLVAQPYWYNVEPIFNQYGTLRIYWPRFNDCILTSCQYRKVVYSRYLAN